MMNDEWKNSLVNSSFIIPHSSFSYLQAHLLGRARDRADSGLERLGIEVGQLLLRDLLDLLSRDASHLLGVGCSGTALDTCSLLQKVRRGRSLRDEGERAVRVDRH